VQSAFLIDLNQVSLALRNSTARSLILLDEFGKGTAAAGSCCYLPCSRSCLSNRLVFVVLCKTFSFQCGWGSIGTPDGAGIFAGVLQHLLSRGTDCPKVIATTHFHELFSTGALEPQKLPVTFMHMKIMFATDNGEVMNDSSSTVTKSDAITFLYRLVS
jgi:DNA mismatch repair protein MSH5